MNLSKIYWRVRKYIRDPHYRFGIHDKLGFFRYISDEKYLKKAFYANLGRELNLDAPKTFNEKLQWLKLYDRKPEYTQMVDKYAVKRYIATHIGEEYVIPTLGVWDRFEDIDFATLPNQFVLKCTHDSGGIVICRDKSTFDIDVARKTIKRSLKTNYYLKGREWPYKDVKPRIIAEKYMEDTTQGEGLTDYKFYCFDGEPKLLYTSKGLEDHSTASISFLNMDWTFAPFGRTDYKPFSTLPKKPENYEEMIRIAKELSAGFSFLRVDLYEVEKKVYFSELTFSPCSGYMPFTHEEWNEILGSWITLPERTPAN